MPGIIIAVVILVAYYAFHRIRARINQSRHAALLEGQLCIWCGKQIDEDQPAIDRSSSPKSLTYNSGSHLACEEQAFTRHRRYYLFFLALAILYTLAVTGVFLSDLAGKHKLPWGAVFGLFGVFWLPLWIKAHIRPWQQMIRQAKEQVKQ